MLACCLEIGSAEELWLSKMLEIVKICAVFTVDTTAEDVKSLSATVCAVSRHRDLSQNEDRPRFVYARWTLTGTLASQEIVLLSPMSLYLNVCRNRRNNNNSIPSCYH